MINKILVLGGTGQLGTEIVNSLSKEGFNILTPSRLELDITNHTKLKNYLIHNKPDLVINCAAYTNVSNCEIYKQESYSLNVKAPEYLSKLCAKADIYLFHFSTDYVFDGSKNSFAEKDICNPINEYGKQKLEAENLISLNAKKHFIFRISWLYSTYRKNFFLTIIDKIKFNQDISVVNDQYGIPTSCAFVAQNINKFLYYLRKYPKSIESTIYHLVPNGYCSWYEFACKIRTNLGLVSTINPIKSDQYSGDLVNRPKNSILNNSLFKKHFKLAFYDWEHYLIKEMEYLNKLNG